MNLKFYNFYVLKSDCGSIQEKITSFSNISSILRKSTFKISKEKFWKVHYFKSCVIPFILNLNTLYVISRKKDHFIYSKN